MEIIKHPQLLSEVIVGTRRVPGGAVGEFEEVMTIVVKATFDAATGERIEGDDELPIFFGDQELPEPVVGEDDVDDEVFRFEHDLAPFKPGADVIILGERPAVSHAVGNDWEEQLQIGSIVVSEKREREIVDGETNELNDSENYVFGWQPRGESPRKTWDKDDLKAGDSELPDSFENRFFNGGPFDGSTSAFDHLSEGQLVVWRSYDNGGEPPWRTREYTMPSVFPNCTRWLHDGSSDDIEMKLDTLVVDSKESVYCIVWRGVVRFDEAWSAGTEKVEITGGIQ